MPDPQLRSPDEILSTLNEKRQQTLTTILAYIAKALEEKYQGEPIDLWVDEPRSTIVAIERKLSQELAAKSWKLIIGNTTYDRNESSTQLHIIPIQIDAAAPQPMDC